MSEAVAQCGQSAHLSKGSQQIELIQFVPNLHCLVFTPLLEDADLLFRKLSADTLIYCYVMVFGHVLMKSSTVKSKCHW